ncbi:hypothetical protein CDD83_10486 [Cordyceps sp. RAO-2017]|nr:hypothetical protein CDD83_10486 [Cordyceps sp. RAO-2017]
MGGEERREEEDENEERGSPPLVLVRHLSSFLVLPSASASVFFSLLGPFATAARSCLLQRPATPPARQPVLLRRPPRLCLRSACICRRGRHPSNGCVVQIEDEAARSLAPSVSA